MAYDFNGSTQRIDSNSSITALSFPITMSCWARTDVASTGQRVFTLRRDSASLSGCIEIGTNATNQWFANMNLTTTNSVASMSTAYSINTWYHLVGVFYSNANRELYVDGVFQAGNTASITDAAHGLPTIGCRRRINSFDIFFNGKIAEAAVWNITLNSSEINSLYKGYKATKVRPENLVYYAPLVRSGNDETSANIPTLVNNPVVFEHPRRYG